MSWVTIGCENIMYIEIVRQCIKIKTKIKSILKFNVKNNKRRQSSTSILTT